MSWETVAHLLASRGDLSALLINEHSECVLVTPAAERALGVPARETIGPGGLEKLIAPHQLDDARWQLQRAHAGAVRSVVLLLALPGGDSLARFEAWPVGQAGGTLLFLEELTAQPRRGSLGDHDYEVVTPVDGPPKLRALYRLGLVQEAATGVCYTTLHGANAPCNDCPLPRGTSERRAPAVRINADRQYELLGAVEVEQNVTRISVRTIPHAHFVAIRDARLHELSRRALLSEREREILALLVSGESLDEIAVKAGISLRTVKFHQSNLLGKLGADSRADLGRLIF